MKERLKETFQLLVKSESQAVSELLLAGLDSKTQVTRHAALRAILERRDPEGHIEVFQRLLQLDEASLHIISERPARLVRAAGEALKDEDPKKVAIACQTLVQFRLYDTFPTVISALVDPTYPHTELVADTILKLTEAFYAELSGKEVGSGRKDQEAIRHKITSALEDGVRKMHRHGRTEVIEAFLTIAKSNNVVLRQLLQRKEEASHEPLVETLQTSTRGAVLRILLGFLEDPQMPRLMFETISSRTDPKFVNHLLRTIGTRPTKTIAETLTGFSTIAWAKPNHEIFQHLDDDAQAGAVALLMGSGVDREQVLDTIGYLLTEGKPQGRRAAAEALATFNGPLATSFIVKAIGDEDPLVRAEVIKQLRPRRVPGAFSLLIRMVDSPENEVRAALREAMPEFTFRHFLKTFDKMDEHLQPLAGHVVRKIDPEIEDKLINELHGPSPVRRRRAVLAAGAMGVSQEMEQEIIRTLSDDDHIVRIAAAKVLADCRTMPSWEALRDALLDRSALVQETAEQSLEEISQWLSTDMVGEETATEEATADNEEASPSQPSTEALST